MLTIHQAPMHPFQQAEPIICGGLIHLHLLPRDGSVSSALYSDGFGRKLLANECRFREAVGNGLGGDGKGGFCVTDSGKRKNTGHRDLHIISILQMV